MKKTYQKPAIELFRLNNANIMAASIPVGGDYEGDLGAVQSKRSYLGDDDDEIAAGW